MRKARAEDFRNYYDNNLKILDDEVVFLTGSKKNYHESEVYEYFTHNLMDLQREDFFIVHPDGTIIGEVVFNEYDAKAHSMNFRIVIFHLEKSVKGLGTWAIKTSIDYVFETLKLNCVELDVFSFNKRAIHVYQKVGFKKVSSEKTLIFDGDKMADDIFMRMTYEDWFKQGK